MEKSLLGILKKLRGEYGAISVKAEFEAEGTRTDELLRLIDLARRADLSVTLKIGGCEAVRDLIESKQFGAEYIIAPMVETPYALQKFIDAKNKIYSPEQQEFTEFMFNLETIAAFNSLGDMVKMAKTVGGVQGIVFGRVDFVGSMGLTRDVIDTSDITDYVVKTAEACQKSDLDLVVGGAISIESLAELRRINACKLSRFETRKVIFSSEALNNTKMADGLKETVYFELLWLKNKQDFYAEIQMEDASRIDMLEKRWAKIKGGPVI
jgi:hypothetical protein